MPRSKVAVALSLSLLIVAGVSWGHAQQKNTGGTLTTQDYIDIYQLYAAYSHAIDLGRGPVAGQPSESYTPDGTFQSSSPGSKPVNGNQSLTRGGIFRGRRHGCINLLITPTPEGANGSCYLYEIDVRDIPARIVISGVMDDTLVKTPLGWRFTKRVEQVDGDASSPYNSKVPRENQPRGQEQR